MLSPDAGAVKCEISDLPPEVLQRIFKYLSANERKAVKLACKSWLEFCNVHSLLNDEVLICLGVYQLSDLYELLGKSDRKFLNLKFQNVTFDHGSSFWESNGPRIRSLDFYDCQFPNGILEEIITFCENLVHLSLTYTYRFCYKVKDGDSLSLIKDLRKISRKGIVRENLDSLEIYIINSYWVRLSDNILHQLLLIFPKVKVLKITSDFTIDGEIDLNLSETTNEDRVTMSPVLNYLIASTDRIEKLKLHFISARLSPNSLRCVLKTVSSLKRLTELSYINRNNTPRLEDICNAFHSKRLKSLEFGMTLDSDAWMSFLSQLFLSNFSLQYLKISGYGLYFSVTKPFFEKLMSSGLNSFVITANEIVMRDPDSFSSYFSAQNKAADLPSLSTFTLESYSGNTIYRYYQNLFHLGLGTISEDELQLLLKYQKKLKSLAILQVDSPIFKVYGHDLRFNELSDIEYLYFGLLSAGPLFLRTLSPEPILLKLKYLRMGLGKAVRPEDLLRAADAMPFLENLYVFNRYCVSFDVIVELCTKLSRLRYLHFICEWFLKDEVLTDEHYRKVFSICPSLRVLVHSCQRMKTYFFDTIRQKVTLKVDDLTYHLGRPRIGELTVSWLEF